MADSLARAHDAGLDHGRMVPENVLIDQQGQVRIIGFAVDAALHGVPPGDGRPTSSTPSRSSTPR